MMAQAQAKQALTEAQTVTQAQVGILCFRLVSCLYLVTRLTQPLYGNVFSDNLPLNNARTFSFCVPMTRVLL